MRENPVIVWEMYQSLEKDFLNILEYVPLTSNHYDVWSYPLVNLFNNIGSSVDSFFKNAVYCESLNNYPEIEDLRALGELNMQIYRNIFESQYKISSKEIFELKNLTPIYPFKEWKNNSTLKWWIRYRKIKHDRFRNKEMATLKTTIDALAGLFALFLTHKETLAVLIDSDVIFAGGHPKQYCKDILSSGEPITETVNRIYCKTPLFGYVFDIEGYQNDDENKMAVLSPSYPGYG